MKKIAPFKGFPRGITHFLSDLEKNNSVEWFKANRERYENELVSPARSFVNDLKPFFSRLNPSIRSEPKFNETLMRLNKDMRFAKGDPYRNYFLIHFGRFKMDSEFYVYFSPNEIETGLFLNNKDKGDLYFRENFGKYKKEIASVFDKYNLNGNFDLYEMVKEPKLSIKNFNAGEDVDRLGKTGYILLQQSETPDKSSAYTDQFLIDTIEKFSSLYPLYIFSICQDPLRELERFEESFGMMIKKEASGG